MSNNFAVTVIDVYVPDRRDIAYIENKINAELPAELLVVLHVENLQVFAGDYNVGTEALRLDKEAYEELNVVLRKYL